MYVHIYIMYVCMYVLRLLIINMCCVALAFVVNHSLQYTVAALCSWLEFWAEAALFGGRRKIVLPVVVVGLIAVLGGQVSGGHILPLEMCTKCSSIHLYERSLLGSYFDICIYVSKFTCMYVCMIFFKQ